MSAYRVEFKQVVPAAVMACLLFAAAAHGAGIVTVSSDPLASMGQVPAVAPVAGAHGYYDAQNDGPCLTDEQRAAIKQELAANVADLKARGVLPAEFDKTAGVLLGWPLRQVASLTDPGVHGISNFVDQHAAWPNHLLDYNCGTRTYDNNFGYNHAGTDFFTWPFSWNKMDDNEVEIVAGADGVIIGRYDGNQDRSCGDSIYSWNAVYVQHSDGSVAWYGHMKNGSPTAKGVGESVVAGEYLGVVGSSGNSSGPHLHLELYNNAGALVDPYAGPCNTKNTDSWWIDQRPYYDSAINALRTHDAPPTWPACPNPSVKHERNGFPAGELVYFATYYRDQLQGQVSQYEIVRPGGAVWQQWTGWSNVVHYAASWWYWSWYLPVDAETGWWKFRVTFEGQTVEHLFSVGNVTDVPDNRNPAFTLHAAAPNPFNPSTNISFALTASGLVELAIHDLQGRRVATLQDGEMTAGEYDVTWNGRADSGQVVASGVYLVSLRQGGHTQSQRVVMLK